MSSSGHKESSHSYDERNGRGERERKDRSYREHSRNSDDAPLSDYYVRRFGSQPPKEYLNLRLLNFDSRISDEDLYHILETELRRPLDFQVKVVRGTDGERMAYVNFERPGAAKIVRRYCWATLREILGRRVTMDPAGVIKDQEGRRVSTDFQGGGGVGGGGAGYHSNRRYYDDMAPRGRRDESPRREHRSSRHIEKSRGDRERSRSKERRREPVSDMPKAYAGRNDDDGDEGDGSDNERPASGRDRERHLMHLMKATYDYFSSKD